MLGTLLPANSRIFYSLKANPQPEIAGFFHRLGIRPEIASEGELEMCLAGGVPSRDVLVGGVAKSGRYLERVCRQGCYAITIDSVGELERLKSVPAAAGKARFLLRVNPGIAIGGLDMGGDSQFGIGVEDAIEVARKQDFASHQLIGLHFYFGSQRLKPEPIVKTVSIITDVLRQFRVAGVPVGLVDLGLGCGVPYLEKDTELDVDLLREQLKPLWTDTVWEGVEVWTEAGRSLVARSGSFVSTVIERKQLNGRTYILLDGGLNVHNPGLGLGRFFKSNPRFQFALDGERPLTEKVEICGSLCTSADRLGNAVEAPSLKPGDLVVVPNSGAYCQTTALWGFNSQTPFFEAMLDTKGDLRLIEPQYRTFVSNWQR
jgi:diaminopimelate decarboxylase